MSSKPIDLEPIKARLNRDGGMYQVHFRPLVSEVETLRTEVASLQSDLTAAREEVERLREVASQAEIEAPIFSALMMELRGNWAQYQHYADLLNEARGFEKARQPK